MRSSFLYKLTLTVLSILIGVSIANLVVPDGISFSSRIIIIGVAASGFGVLGFLLPQLTGFFVRVGIQKARRQLANLITSNAGDLVNLVSPLGFGRRRRVRKEKYQNPLVVDTSVLVDGRVADIIKTGFIQGTMIVIPSVINELHLLSDSHDDLKRARGRRGLDILEEMRANRAIRLEVLDSEPVDSKVDNKLVSLAKKLRGAIMTVDFNLGKVAKVRGIKVLNINELANALKTVTLPGEEMIVTVNTAGKGKDQGVGFLEDGTMVVVEGGAAFVGMDIKVKVNKVLQTAAGKMMFARPTS